MCSVVAVSLYPLASLPVCTSASLVVLAHDPVALGYISSGGHLGSLRSASLWLCTPASSALSGHARTRRTTA